MSASNPASVSETLISVQSAEHHATLESEAATQTAPVKETLQSDVQMPQPAPAVNPSSEQVKPKLFISFTSTMSWLDAGFVNEQDLQVGLFIFGCTRQHAMEPQNDEFVEATVRERPDLHAMLVRALLKAEQEGRARFRTIDEVPSFAGISALLVANGFSPLASVADVFGSRGPVEYCLDAVSALSTQLDVVPSFTYRSMRRNG